MTVQQLKYIVIISEEGSITEAVSVLGIMKYIGAAYILFPAFHIAVSKPTKEVPHKSASFYGGMQIFSGK